MKKTKIQSRDFHIVCLFKKRNTRAECVKVLLNFLVFKEVYDDDLCTSFLEESRWFAFHQGRKIAVSYWIGERKKQTRNQHVL